MILSFEKKFLFVKSFKAAGSSIEIALSKGLSSNSDIITPMSPSLEIERIKEGGLSPQNYATLPSNLIEKLRLYKRFISLIYQEHHYLHPYASLDTSTQAWMRVKQKAFPQKYSKHMPLDGIISRIGQDTFKSLYSFTFVRHPYSKILSLWMYLNSDRDLSQLSLEQIRKEIENLVRKSHEMIPSQKFCLSEKYQCQVNKVYRFETIDWAIKDICLNTGLDEKVILPLPKANHKSGLKSRLKFSKEEILNDKLKQLIQEKCHWEFDNFYEK